MRRDDKRRRQQSRDMRRKVARLLDLALDCGIDHLLHDANDAAELLDDGHTPEHVAHVLAERADWRAMRARTPRRRFAAALAASRLGLGLLLLALATI